MLKTFTIRYTVDGEPNIREEQVEANSYKEAMNTFITQFRAADPEGVVRSFKIIPLR
jgi:hypothetical protein